MKTENELTTKTEAASATKTVPESEQAWPWVKRLVATIKYLNEEKELKLKLRLGLGLVVIAYLAVTTSAKEITAIFHFPPEDKPFARFLIFGVALTTWGITRSKLHDHATKSTPSKGKSGENKSDREYHRRTRDNATKWFVGSIVLFCLYYTVSGNFVATATPATGGNVKEAQTEFQETLFSPLWPSDTFKNKIVKRGESVSGNTVNYSRAFKLLVDNDAYWLEDTLTEVFWQVLATKLLVLALILGATCTMVYSTTVISSLPKLEIGAETVLDVIPK